MQRQLTNPNTGEPPPAGVLQGSRIARLLYARRRGASGVSFEELAVAVGSPARARGQIDALRSALGRFKSPWVVDWQIRADEDGMEHVYFWLTAPWCPRGVPYRAQEPDGDPELISLDDLANEERK